MPRWSSDDSINSDDAPHVEPEKEPATLKDVFHGLTLGLFHNPKKDDDDKGNDSGGSSSVDSMMNW